jgi:hypothetical protein
VGVVIGPDLCVLRCWIKGVSTELAANGSCSTIRGEGEDVEVRLCLRALGFGFWREARTFGEGGREAEEGGWRESVGVFGLRDEMGGAGAFLDGI